MEPPRTTAPLLPPDAFRTNLERLIKRFDADRFHHLSKDYSEAQARIDFIGPLFEILGWDVANKEGLPHQDREVIVERGEKDTPGRPDYSFRIGGQTKFFVEAKAPCESLEDPRHIFQAKSYAWSTNSVSFVVLTDFEEFRFYDATLKPDERKPAEGILLHLKYTEYLKHLESLWDFSRERVRAGSLEALLPRDRRTARLRIPPDESFLDQMTAWREDLARNVYKNNPDLTARQLNEIVQRLLDRIVFIRIAEDRRVVEKNLLRDVVDEWKARGDKLHIFEWLNDLFHRINEDFNGEIFKPHLSEEIKIDSEVLAHIIENLYAPKSPFRFDVIGVELLGSIYERYLGKTIRPTAKQVRVEEKPEVRKAGGVYYTPKYIVDYIVKNTVGKIIEGKTPKQIEKIRILDPACGSGSFLIGAFQYLIDYHVRYLAAHPEEVQTQGLFPDLIKDENGEPRLSAVRKAAILKNNLFGVDIDPQAVEITMMSLYLKALEGERSVLPPKQHILPELKYNIICGNSLIGPDVYQQGALFGDTDRERINAFDWDSEKSGFGRIMKEGGFDSVVANPPYIRIQTLQQFSPIEADYLKQHYTSASAGNFDIYVCFVEKGLSILRDSGRLGFIIPSKFFQTDYGRPLRDLLTSNRAIETVIDFSHLQVFDGPTTYTCLLFLSRTRRNALQYTRIENEANLPLLRGEPSSVQTADLSSGPWTFASPRERKVFEKIESDSVRLIDLPSEISRGSSSGADQVFVVRRTEKNGIYVSRDGQTIRLENGILRIPLYATDFNRYYFGPDNNERIIFPYSVHGGSAELISERDLKREFPRTLEYLRERRHLLSARKQFTAWYSFSAPRNLPEHDTASLLVPLLANHGLFSEFPEHRDHFCLMASGGFSIKLAEHVAVSAKYLLALLNSTLLFTYLKAKSNVFRGGWITCTKQYVGPLPIKLADERHQNDLIVLANQMTEATTKKHSGRLAQSEVGRLERAIAAIDAEIDNLVYEIYGITADERKLIEEAMNEKTHDQP